MKGVKIMKKMISFVLLFVLILYSSLSILAHPTMLNVNYDECSQEEHIDGEDELWYRIDEIFPPSSGISLHMSHAVLEIKYYFSYENDQTWTKYVKDAAQQFNVSLSESEALTIVQSIQNCFVNSMKRWNDVYYYSYDDNNNRIKNKIITVKQGTQYDNNVVIYPKFDKTGSLAGTKETNMSDFILVGAFHSHVPHHTIRVNVYDFYQIVTHNPKMSEVQIEIYSQNTGAHEIGHVLGLADLDAWDCACQCIYCTDNDIENDDECTYKGHHEEALMGYGVVNERVDHITYKDIAGVSITRGFHTDDHHLWMFRENENEETNELDSIDAICALCNGVRYDIDLDCEEYSSLYTDGYIFNQSCTHYQGTNEEMILVATDGERNFFKCRYCRYIQEVDINNAGTIAQYEGLDFSQTMSALDEKYYKLTVSDFATYNFKATDGSGLQITLCDSDFNELSDISTSAFTSNGYSRSLIEGTYYLHIKNNTSADINLQMTVSPPPHTHNFDTWVAMSPTMHIKNCGECGAIGTETGAHAVRATTARFAPCLLCGYIVDLDNSIGQVPIMNVDKVTINGSYILPNGIIVLVDEDIEAYLNGTLVFYDKNDLPVTQ